MRYEVKDYHSCLFWWGPRFFVMKKPGEPILVSDGSPIVEASTALRQWFNIIVPPTVYTATLQGYTHFVRHEDIYDLDRIPRVRYRVYDTTNSLPICEKRTCTCDRFGPELVALVRRDADLALLASTKWCEEIGRRCRIKPFSQSSTSQ